MCPADDDEYLPRNARWNSTSGWVMYSLEKSGLGESDGMEVGCCRGSFFYNVASPSLLAAPKVLLEWKHKRAFFPKLIAQLDLPIFLSLTGLCIRPRNCRPVLYKCLSMGDFKLSSQFKKLYVFIARMVKILGGSE